MRINNSHNLITVKNEFVTYEQALALKELGFDEPCCAYVYTGDTGNNIDRYEETEPSRAINFNHDSLCISQPLKQQVFRWFREEYNKLYAIDHSLINGWYFVIREIGGTTDPILTAVSVGDFKTYEEAESVCIDKLIEIIKK